MGTELTKCCRSAENNQIEINLEAKTDHLIIKATPCKPENLVNKRNSSMLVSSCSSKTFTDDRFKQYKRKQSQKNVMNKADLDHKLVNMKNHLEELTKASTKEGTNVNEESQGDHSAFLMTSPLLSPNKKRRSFEVINEELTSHQLCFLRKILFTEGLLVEEMDESTINMIFNCISYIRIKAGYVLFSSNKQEINLKGRKEENCYYIIEKGKLEYKIDDFECTLNKHECISTQALAINSKERYTLESKERCYLFALPVEQFKNIITKFANQFHDEKIEILKKVYLFQWMNQKLLNQIANMITIKLYEKSTMIIKEETVHKLFYIISEGEVTCGKNDHIIKKLRQYSIFGHMAIFTQNESLYTFTVEENTTLLGIKIEEFLDCFGENAVKYITYNMFAYSVKNSPLISKYYDEDNIQTLFDLFQLKYYFSDILVYKKQKKMLMALSGSLYKSAAVDKMRGVSSFKCNQEEEIANDGSLYGEELLTVEDQSSFFVISSDECVVFEAQWNEILKITKAVNKTTSLYNLVHLIKIHPYFKGISELKLFRLGEALKVIKFKPYDVILKDGPSSDKFYKIRSGKVKVQINNTDVKTLEEGQCFGDIISQSGSYLTTANYTALTNVECFYLEKEIYDELFDCEILQPYKSILNVKDITVTLDQLYYIKELGQGSYGKVYLVHDKKRPYAMKTAEIKEMIKNKESAQLYLNEKSILSSIDHPFIIQLINTFKTREYIFFLLEYVDGMTLKAGLQTRKPSQLRNCNDVAFYGGILSNILNYLQRNKIIHRDLKPDNIMIDKIGYLKAIDFGIAKKLIGKDSTHSILGTIQYMAPEVVLGKNYSFAVDYWSVGIILYEVFYGKVPFGFGSIDPVVIYKEITEKNPSLNREEKSEAFNSFIKKLLKKNPNKRITSYSKFKSQPLLALIDYDKLLKRELTAPIIPWAFKFKEKDLSNVVCSFNQYMKNHVFASSNELDELIKTNEIDFLSEF